MDCINCGAGVNAKYCSACGQRTDVKRLTFREGWNDFWARIYGFDGMFPRTLRDLTIRPGEASQKYIEGNRALYYGPVGYFFLMITVFLLFMNLIDVEVAEFFEQRLLMTGQAGQQKMLQSIMGILSENMKIIAFFMLPFNAIVARYILFRKSELNLIEHLVLPFYVMGHMYWLNILSVSVYKFTGSFFMNTVTGVATYFYFGLAYSGLITNQSKTKVFLKGMAVPILGMIVWVTFILLIIIILIFTVPEFYEFVRPSNNR